MYKNFNNNHAPRPQMNNKWFDIPTYNVRLMDENKKFINIVSRDEARGIARERNLDLIPLNLKADPVVCMLGDYNKYMYDQKKSARETEKKQRAAARAAEEKMISYPADTTDSSKNDRIRLIAQANDFLAEGHKVTFKVFCKGRKMTHADEIMARIREELNASVTNGTAAGTGTSDKEFLIKFMPNKEAKNG